MNEALIFRPYRLSLDDTSYRDILPHRSRSGKTVFVTWRLSDSLPAETELEASLRRAEQRWLVRKGLPFCPWSQDVETILLERYPEMVSEYRLIQFRVRETFDSRELGSCVLRHHKAVEAVRTAILEEGKWKVGIGDFVISCNHVHLLLMLGDEADLQGSLQRIKGRASCYLGRAGLSGLPKTVWQRYWFDHVVRNWAQLNRIRHYIADHPVRHKEAHRAVEWREEE
jgi:REP element-mobilizing transposase RayT